MSNMKELERRLAQGNIDRREFLHRAAAIGVVGGVPALLTESAQAMTPKKGGRLRMASPTEARPTPSCPRNRRR